jgi:lysophospholipase L1-like esterase
MFSIYTNLKNDRQYRAATGLDIDKFQALPEVFAKHFVAKKNSTIGGKITRFTEHGEALFFVLFYLKTYPTLQVLGLQFGISDTCAQGNLAYLMPFLKAALKAKNTLVSRIFESQESFAKAFEGVEGIFIDGTEFPIERADNEEVQEKTYSGKKNFIPSFY